jgi:mRNA-degrading endonuclease YafQ of YafQ-DinJ toxin-antitoxin module
MQVFFHKHFQKRYVKLPIKIKDKFDIQLDRFYDDPHDGELRNHELHGKYAQHRSIDVTGDVRAIYKETEKGVFLFVDIDRMEAVFVR